MQDNYAEECRKRVLKALGAAVASKASDTFCVAFVHPEAAPFQMDRVLSGKRLVNFYLFRQPPPPLPLRSAVESMRRTKGWEDALEATRSVLAASLGSRSAMRLNPALTPTMLLRQVYVNELRDRCYDAAGPVLDFLEWSAAVDRLPFHERSGTLGEAQTLYCWLNQTIRTWISDRTLANLAEDPQVVHLDLSWDPQWEFSVMESTLGTARPHIPSALTGKGVSVAVLDSEVDRSHSAFGDRIHNMGNFSTENWGFPRSHGTAIAGIIAAQHEQFPGIAPDTTIFSYKLSPRFPAEEFFQAYALQQALVDGAHIANCSLQSSSPTDGGSRLVHACDQAWACGMTIVKSAGNKGPGSQSVTCPADAQGVIVVGATDLRGTMVLETSSRGPALNSKPCPDLVSPGGEGSEPVFTCLAGGGFGGILTSETTSLAAAYVSGVLALLLEAEPDSTPDELRERLFDMCEKLPEEHLGESIQGRGRVSLDRLPKPGGPAQARVPEEIPRPASSNGSRPRSTSGLTAPA